MRPKALAALVESSPQASAQIACIALHAEAHKSFGCAFKLKLTAQMQLDFLEIAPNLCHCQIHVVICDPMISKKPTVSG